MSRPTHLEDQPMTVTCNQYGSGPCPDWLDKANGIDGDPAVADVLWFGDSITTRCRGYVRTRLAGYGLTVCFDYWSGRPTDEPGATVDRALSYTRAYDEVTPAKLIVMATGSNDVSNPPVMAAAIQRMVDAPLTAPLAWVNTYVCRWAGDPAREQADLRNTAWLNQQIAASGVPVIGWFENLAKKPWRALPGGYLEDGLHPTATTGCDNYGAVVAARVAQLVGVLA